MITTLAQRIVNGKVRIEDLAQHLAVLDRLAPRVGASVTDAKKLAERFHFEEPPYHALKSVLDDGSLQWDTVLETAQPITEPMWLEWLMPPNVMLGFLVHREGFRTHVRVCAGHSDEAGLAGVLLVLSFEGAFPIGISMPKGLTIHYYSTSLSHVKDIQSTGVHLMKEVIAAMFVLCTPRVADLEPLIHHRAERRRQIREHPDRPLVEFKTVKMKIGSPVARHQYETYDERGDHETIHRRLHRVVGHFREYRKGRETPRVSFIPEHWRGDASLGIVLHTREVVKPPKESPHES